MMIFDKPRICKVKPLASSGWQESKGKWLCHNNFFTTAQGDTPQQAYHNWRERMKTLTNIPRAGTWNKKDVMNWFLQGCYPIRSYVGVNPQKRIVGYNPSTDELILQG